MKRKLQTIGWLTAFFALALLWVSPAMAEDYGLYIAGVQVTDANCNALSTIEGVTVAAGGEFKYDPATKTLTMKDVTVSVGYRKDAIVNRGVEGLKIVVSGSNRLEATNWSALDISASTTIEGSGSLIAVSDYVAFHFHKTTITISDITLEATGYYGIAGGNGMENETLILRNAKVTATGTAAGIVHLASFTTEGFSIIIPVGGDFNTTKHAVVDAEGNVAKRVKIAPSIDVYDLHIAGTQVTDLNCDDLSKIAGVTVAAGGEFKYDPATKALTMKDVTVSVGDGKDAILNRGVEGLKIVVSGTNRIEATDWSALIISASTTIEGSGSFITVCNKESGVSVYIGSEATLTVSDITFEASGKWGIIGSTTLKGKALILRNATVKATGTEAGIAHLTSFTTEGCEIVVPTGGKFDQTKYAVVDAEGNNAKEVKIEPAIYVAETRVTNDNCNDLSGITDVTVAADGEFKYDPATKTLYMKNVTVSVGNEKNPIRNASMEGLKIVVSGTNRLEATNRSSLSCLASTEIKGSGSLTTTSSRDGGVYLAVAKTLTISDITLETSGVWGITGLFGNGDETLILKNANVTATGTEAGIDCLASFTTEECEIVVPAGGKFEKTKHAVVDAGGNKAKTVRIERTIKLYIAGTPVTDANCNDLSGITDVTVAAGGEFRYDPATKTLTMKDVTVSVGDGKNAMRNEIEGLKIVVSGTNRLESTNRSSLSCLASTEIKGNGSLTAMSSGRVGMFVGMSTEVTISDITFAASGKRGISGVDGIEGEALFLKNAKVTATGTEAGITSLISLTFEDCKIVVPEGGYFDGSEHAVVDADGNIAKEVKIEPKEKYELYIADTQVTEANCNDLSGITGVTVDSGGEFQYDPAEKTLTMKEVTVTVGNNTIAILNKGVEGLKIVVSGTNRLEATDESALACLASTEIEGNGSLTAMSSGRVGLFVESTDLTISNITLEATGKWGIAGWTGMQNETLILKNAKVTATGTVAGIADLAAFTTEGCKIVTPAGGKFDETKHAVVDAEGNVAEEVKIGSAGGAVTGITLSQHVLSLVKGTTATLTAEISPADAPNKNFSWHSDNEAVATVENGVVTAVDKGEAIIRVTTEEGNKTDECKVTVRGSDDIAVTGVQLSPKELTLKVGTSLKLVAKVEPANATNKVVTWQCSDESVASVSDQGLVEAKAAGTSIITVTTADGGHTATCSLTVVTEDVRLTSIKVSPSEMRITVGQNTTLNVSYEPAGATQKAVTWETNDAAIVTVDANGNIKGVAEGEAIITAKSKQDETIKSTCKVVVTPATAVEDTVFASVVIAPNPFGNQLRIVNGELRGEYALLNAQGIVVRSGNADGNEVVIETRDLTSGLYLLRLTATNGATKTYRVVKQ